MKKKSTFLLLLATLLFTMVSIEGFAYKTGLAGSQEEEGYRVELENPSGDYYSPEPNTYVVNKRGGNNMMTSTTIATAFSFSGNVEILDGDRMSLVFGSSGTPAGKWYGVELAINKNNNNVNTKAFQDNGLNPKEFFYKSGIAADITNPIPFKIDVTAAGVLTVYINGIQQQQYTIANYIGGRLGILTFNSKAKLSDVLIMKKDKEEEGGVFNTNTTGWAMDPKTNGVWKITPAGLYGSGSDNSPYFSSSSAANFTLSSEMTFKSNTQVGGLVFRANTDHSIYYAVSINNNAETVCVLKFYKNPETGVISDVVLGGADSSLKTIPGYVKKNQLKLSIAAVKSCIMVYVDDNLVITASDDDVLEGAFGITNYSSEIIFQNLYYQELTELPLLTGLTTDFNASPAYSTDIFKYDAIVPYETNKVSVTPTTDATNELFVNDMAVISGSAVSVDLQEGNNVIWIKVKDRASNVFTITELSVKRRWNPETAYMEPYRPQFHYTPEAHWVNDPNGMVYFDGEYHLFYQYHPYSKQWGPMHWGHAISPDMINWQEYPIALYPDQFGTIYSGSAVVDHNNTSGFFTDVPGQKGIVAIYTSAGARQQQAIAYSLDKGRTWIKYNKGEPVIKVADDPYNTRDEGFRDPKVFWHTESNQWMMAVAGGPLRFYSSHDLKNWTFESGYIDDQTIDGKLVRSIHTECPDFYKLPVEDGAGDKWVLEGSSKFYMIGDFKKVGNKWYYIPDSDNRYDPNFGLDDYAGQTFSDVPDGRRIMMHWMTNFDYAGDLANITDPYNGAFSLPYKLTLKQTAGGIRLFQTPVKELENLRKKKNDSFKDVTVTATSENILKDVKGKQFEIVAEITPERGNVQSGFKLCTGNGQETKVYYNNATGMLTVDRTNSGATPNGRFTGTFSRQVEKKDGKLKLHILVDCSTIEVFVNDGEAVATAYIFPDTNSDGMEFFVEGNPAKVNMTIYQLKSIWRKSAEEGTSFFFSEKSYLGVNNIYSSAGELNIEVSDDINLNAGLFNLEGKKFLSETLTAGTNKVALPQGIYILKLTGEDKTLVKKIIIQ